MTDYRLRQRAQTFIIIGIILIVIGIILEAILWWFFYLGALSFLAGVCFLVIGIVWHCQANRAGAQVNVVHVTQPQPMGATVIATTHTTMMQPPPPPMYGYVPQGPMQGYQPPPMAAPPGYGNPPGLPGTDPAYPPSGYSQPPPAYGAPPQNYNGAPPPNYSTAYAQPPPPPPVAPSY